MLESDPCSGAEGPKGRGLQEGPSGQGVTGEGWSPQIPAEGPAPASGGDATPRCSGRETSPPTGCWVAAAGPFGSWVAAGPWDTKGHPARPMCSHSHFLSSETWVEPGLEEGGGRETGAPLAAGCRG